jgi:hypothetical protein
LIIVPCFRGSVVEKRAKKDEGGLLSGWSNRLAKQRLETITGFSSCMSKFNVLTLFFYIARNMVSREAVEDEDDPLEYAGGEFDGDEPIEAVKAARDVKKLAISVRGKVSSPIHSTALSVLIHFSILLDDRGKNR